jgi:hypothetical protein
MIARVFVPLLLCSTAFRTGMAAATTCGMAKGKYNFAELMQYQLKVKGGEYEYTLKLCGTSSQQCPQDQDEVKTGMATQTNLPDHCYVLAQYDTTAVWTEGKQTASLSFANGTPEDCPDGLPRHFKVSFTCDSSQSKGDLANTALTVLKENQPCYYEYAVKTCLACDAGCASGLGFGGLVLLIFCIAMGTYLLVGIAWNAFKLKKQGLEILPNRELWASFFGYVKDGIQFSFLVVTCKHNQASYDTFGGDATKSPYPDAESAAPYAAGSEL